MKKWLISIAIFCIVAVSCVWYMKRYETIITIEVTAQEAIIYGQDERVGTLQHGATFQTTSHCDAKWCYSQIEDESVKVAVTDVTQYEHKQPIVTEAASDRTVTTLYDATLYSTREMTAQPVAIVAAGQTLQVLDEEAEWVTVRFLGETMYMKPQQLTTVKKQARIVHVEANTPLYMSKQQQHVVATTTDATTFSIVREERQHYVVRIGVTEAFIEKQQQIVTTEQRAHVHMHTTAHIVSDAAIPVYRQNKELVLLQADYRYPVVAIAGDTYVLTIGEEFAYVKKEDAALDVGLPALVYHHILEEAELGDYAGASSTVTTEAFQQQMTYLHSNGFTTLSAAEAASYMNGHIVPKKAVIITFDDGLLSAKQYAYPVLKQYAFTALQHIISARMDRFEGMQQFDATAPLQFMTKAEMAHVADVFSYEAHTFNLHILDEEREKSRLVLANAGELRDDLRQNIEDVPTATTFAYPFGQYKQQTIDVLMEFQFALAFTTLPGYSTVTDCPYKMKRFTPTQSTTLEQFMAYVEGAYE